MAETLLEMKDVHAWYGESHILHGVNLAVNKGEVVTLLGRNGAGRTTTLKAILGLVGRRSGSIRIDGAEAADLPPHRIAHMGLDEIYAMFPNLKERRASPGGRLSGGEQQMLAVARILRTGAKLLLLDEISEGLAPVIVQTLARMIQQLRERGFTILMVEQNFRFAAPLADRFYIMERGLVLRELGAAELQDQMPLLHQYLGV